MASLSLTLFLLLSCIIHRLSANSSNPTCPQPFRCGNLGTLKHPFTTFFRPRCGTLIVNCTEPVSTIQLGRNGPWYDVKPVALHSEIFALYDKNLNHFLNSDLCDSISGFPNLNFPSVFFTVLSNMTFYRCPLSPRPGPSSSGQVPMRNCSSFNIYSYENYTEGFFRNSCLVYPFPDSMIMELSKECLDCIHDEGECEDLGHGEFHCINSEKEKRKLRLILGLAISGGITIFTALALVILWYHRKFIFKFKSSTYFSTAVSRGREFEKSNVYFNVPIFSYDELEDATNNFDRSRELGDGGFGTVYYGKLNDGRVVAVKRLYDKNGKRVEQFLNEVEILATLHHPNLVSLHGCTSRHSRELLLVYEYVPNGMLADHLYGQKSHCGFLTWTSRLNIALETASALAYLHTSDIIHRDVKTSNILLDDCFRVKVADFGMSRLIPTDVTHISTAPQGTPGYLDPEYHQCFQLTDKSDVYSFGVVLIELLSSLPAVDINREEHEIYLPQYAMDRIQVGAFENLIDSRLGYESNEMVKRTTIMVAELAFLCLQHKRGFRPSMREVLDSLKRINQENCKAFKTVERTDTKVVVDCNELKNSAKEGDYDDICLLDNLPKSSSKSLMIDK